MLRLRKCGRHFSRVFALYFLTFMVILPLLCNQLKFSIYYGVIWPTNLTKETHKLREENHHRLSLARDYLEIALKNIDKTSDRSKFAPPKNFTDIIITVITVSRKSSVYNPSYLTQTVSKLLNLLNSHPDKLLFSYGLMVCNVDNAPDDYAEAKELSSLVHTVFRYKNNVKVDLNRFEKEKQDYVYCLRKSLMFQPKYVLLLEDDAYPTNHMLSVLEYSIQNIFEGKVSEYWEQRNKVAYLKLYHPERLLSFISLEIYRLFELGGAVLVVLAGFVVLNRNWIICNETPWKSVFVAGIYIVLLALVIGRQHLIGVRKASKYFHSFVPAPSCCTPANLFSHSGALATISSLNNKFSYSGHAKDALLDEFLREMDYKAVYVEPNIFQHIGQYSSLRRGSLLHPLVV